MRDRILAALLLSLTASVTQAALLGRAPLTAGGSDYQAYYDTDLHITWLADADYAQTSGAVQYGDMSWDMAMAWVSSLNGTSHLGATNWRLPSLSPLDGIAFAYEDGDRPGATFQNGGLDRGYRISAPGSAFAGSTANEIAHLYYNTLGNAGNYAADGSSNPCRNIPPDFCLTNTGPFQNVHSYFGYWYGLEYGGPDPDRAWRFLPGSGFADGISTDSGLFAWAVRDGDIAAIPLPATGWLAVTSALALVRWARRRRHTGKAAGPGCSGRSRC